MALGTKPIAGVFQLFGSRFDDLMTGERRQDIRNGGERGNVSASEQHQDGSSESDRATSGTAYESDLVVVLSHVERLARLAEDFLLECEVHSGLPD
jgi:hypothetical protein